MRRYLLAIGLVACDASNPPAAKQAPPSRPAVPIVDAAVADATVLDTRHVEPPAAVVDPLEKYFLLAPMATRDGKHALIPVTDDDGARAMPNLALEVRDRSDKVIDRVVVLALDEELDDKQRAERAALAERLLAKHELTSLVALMPTGKEGIFTGPDASITSQRARFSITPRGDRRRDFVMPRAWRGTTYYDKREGVTCKNPEFVNNAWVGNDARLAVVEVAYHGNDTCWAPSRQRHVVAW